MKKLWLNILNLIDNKPIFTLLILLSFQLSFRLIIFFTTNTFAFTDWRGYLAAIEQIKGGENLPLFYRAFTYLLSYLGYFFKYILGNLDYFFIFNSILGVLVSSVSFLIVKEITSNNRKAILVVLLQTIYVEFLAFSSIFYTVIIMLLLVNLIIYLLIKIIKEEKIFKLIFYGLLSVLIAYLSYFFKIELKYFAYLLLIFALINFKSKPLFIKFLLIGLLFLFSIITFENYQKQFYVNTGKITHIFFGHTYYGGFGGEGSFIFKENQEKYETRMKKYFDENNIKSPTPQDTGNFQKHEMFNFIKKEPHMWLLLQVRKFFFTFGIVPEGNSFTILYKGLFNRNFIITSAIIVFPVVIFVILFVLVFKKESYKLILNDKKLLLMFLMLFYYLAATIFYGPYQERYRIPVLTLFILPFIAIFSDNLSFKSIFGNKKSLFIKILILLTFITVWSYQAYEALILSKERYGIVFDKDF
ncbi:MAG: hypothetical protein N2319_03955 [Candidatus Kapabacteria bacterium]|nr:hypothetical protein [Candidatus Kapabacteria bacterium]